jgi:hypothetical protein
MGRFRHVLKLLPIGAVITVAWFLYQDISSQDSSVCRAPVFQPAISDICGNAGVGGQPSAEERIAWAARPESSCEAIRDHVSRFPDGAYRSGAADLLAARQTAEREIWSPRDAPVEVVLGYGDHISSSLEEARVEAFARARDDALGQCSTLLMSGRFRLHDAIVRDDALQCVNRSGGSVCRYDGPVDCQLAARRTEEIETCG